MAPKWENWHCRRQNSHCSLAIHLALMHQFPQHTFSGIFKSAWVDASAMSPEHTETHTFYHLLLTILSSGLPADIYLCLYLPCWSGSIEVIPYTRSATLCGTFRPCCSYWVDESLQSGRNKYITMFVFIQNFRFMALQIMLSRPQI